MVSFINCIFFFFGLRDFSFITSFIEQKTPPWRGLSMSTVILLVSEAE